MDNDHYRLNLFSSFSDLNNKIVLKLYFQIDKLELEYYFIDNITDQEAEMIICALYGSANRTGKSSSMLEYFLSDIQGHTVNKVKISELKMAPCRGCLKCRPDKICILPEDDAQRTGKLMEQSDLIIIGTPTYWGNIPGTLKMLFDRNVTSLEHFTPQGIPTPRMKGKQAIIIVSSAAPWPVYMLGSQAGGAVRALKTILKASGMTILKTVIISGNSGSVMRKLSILAGKINARASRRA